jgi:membrane protein DedA with SNARE-associated domain
VLASVTGSITSFIGSHGVYAVFALMALDAVFPAASELVMVYAGALASGAFAGQHVVLFGGRIDSAWWAFLTMSLAGTVGYLLGSLAGWAIGRHGGRPLVERHGRVFHLGPDRLERAERWFDRWDDWAVLLGRVTPVVRSFVSIPAGIFEMPLGRYTALTIPGSLVWCFAFAGVGWGVGTSYRHFHHAFDYVDVAVVAGAVLLALYLVLRGRSTRLNPRAQDPPR